MGWYRVQSVWLPVVLGWLKVVGRPFRCDTGLVSSVLMCNWVGFRVVSRLYWAGL